MPGDNYPAGILLTDGTTWNHTDAVYSADEGITPVLIIQEGSDLNEEAADFLYLEAKVTLALSAMGPQNP